MRPSRWPVALIFLMMCAQFPAAKASHAAIAVSPGSVDFGVVTPWTQAHRNVTVTNTGSVALYVNGVNVAGGGSQFGFRLGSHSCSNLSAGQSCNVELVFSASIPIGTTEEGNLTITYQGTSHNAPAVAPLRAFVGYDPRCRPGLESPDAVLVAPADGILDRGERFQAQASHSIGVWRVTVVVRYPSTGILAFERYVDCPQSPRCDFAFDPSRLSDYNSILPVKLLPPEAFPGAYDIRFDVRSSCGNMASIRSGTVVVL